MVENREQTPLGKTAVLLLEAIGRRVSSTVELAKKNAGKKTNEKPFFVRLREIFTERRVQAEKASARKFTSEIKKSPSHITISKRDWALSNGYTPKGDSIPEQLQHSKSIMEKAMNASKTVPKWFHDSRIRNLQHCPQAAEFVARVALLPEKLQEDPHVLFMEIARLEASQAPGMSKEALREHIQVRNTAIERLKELRARSADFNLTDREILQSVTEQGMGAMPIPPTPDEIFGINFSSLSDEAKSLFRALNIDITKPGTTTTEKHQILEAYSARIDQLDTHLYSEAQYNLLTQISVERAKLAYESAPSRGLEPSWFERHTGIIPKTKGTYLGRILSEAEMIDLCREFDEDGVLGVDAFVFKMNRRILTSSREPRAPDLQEQSQYWEIEQLYKHVFGEEGAQARLKTLRDSWETEYRRNATRWYLERGQSGAKDIITKFSESIPSDTMQYERDRLWGPQAITALEHAHFERGRELAHIFNEGEKFFMQDITIGEHTTTRLEAFIEGKLQGADWQEAQGWQRKISHGSYIKSKDTQSDTGSYHTLTDLHDRVLRKFIEVHGGKMPLDPGEPGYAAKQPAETAELQQIAKTTLVRPDGPSVYEKLQDQWCVYLNTDKPGDFIGEELYNRNALNKWMGCSPIEIRAMIKLELMLKAGGINNLEEKTWKLGQAITAASRYMVGSYRSVVLNHQLVNMPALLTPILEGGGSVMLAPAQEQLGRVENPEFFYRRFSLGGENQGVIEWSNLIINKLEDIGIKLEQGDRILPSIDEENEPYEMRLARTLLLKSRKVYGSAYTEVERNSVLEAFSIFDGTAWRIAEAIREELQKKYGEHAKNVAFGISLMLKGGAKNINVRKEIWSGVADRTPSTLIHHMSTDETNIALHAAGMDPGNKEWHRFMDILSVVELQIVSDEAIITNDLFNLGNRGDFDTLFSDDLFNKAGIMNANQITALRDKYYKVVCSYQNTFRDQYLDLWAKNDKRSITISAVDLDPKLITWENLPEDQLFRRVKSDAEGHLIGYESIMNLSTKPELCVRPDMKELMKEYKNLKMGASYYNTTRFAEGVVLKMVDSLASYTGAKDFYKYIRFIPGANWFFRQLAHWDTEKKWVQIVLNKSVRAGLRMIANNRFLVRDPEERRVFNEILKRDIKEWPKNFAQLHLSAPIAASGPTGPAYDAIDKHELIEELEESGIITVAHKELHKLKDKHKTRFFSRALAVWQRYWWLPWVATVAVGVTVAFEESKGKGGGSGGGHEGH